MAVAAGLPASGTFAYNGFSFGNAERIAVQSRMVYDEAGWTVTHVEYTFTVDAIIPAAAGQSNADSVMETIRQRCSSPGATLICNTKGFGDITVNLGGVQDVAWGPRPLSLTMTPIADNKAVAVTFVVATTIAECDCNGCARQIGIMALNYDITLAINEHGDLTRTISGYYEIAQTRNFLSRNVADNVDRYLSTITSNAPAGFNRTSQRTISKDRRRLNFQIVDTQIPSRIPYPVGVTAITGSHQVSWQRRKGAMAKLRNIMSMQISPASTIAAEHAYYIFTQALATRRKAAGGFTVLEALDIEEDLFGRPVKMAASYLILSDVDKIIQKSGLFTGLGTSWASHAASLTGVQSLTGTSGYTHPVGVDRITDLCAPANQSQWNPQTQGPGGTQQQAADAFQNAQPPAQQSWLGFWSRYEIEEKPLVSVHSPIQAADAPRGDDLQNSKPADFGDRAGDDDLIQRHGRARYELVWYGMAERVGHAIPKPIVKKIGKANATEVGGQFHSSLSKNLYGQKVYEATWALVYALDNHPGQVNPPDNLSEYLSAVVPATAPKP